MFTLTEDETLVRDAATSFVTHRAPVTAFRATRDAGKTQDDTLWAEMAAMGWAGILVPEEHGGTGMGMRAAGVILEQLGRTLAASPFLSTAVIGASALLLGGSDDQKAAHLPALAEGKRTFALAVDDGPHHAPDRITASAEKGPDGWRIVGTKPFVPDGAEADVLIVAANTAAGVTLFLVDGTAAGVTRMPLATVDSRAAARIVFESAPGEPLGAIGGGSDLLDAILDRARIAIAAEMLGSAQAAFDMTAEYLKTRTQFGQVIGTFQGLQHRAAALFADLEFSRSAVLAALDAADNRANDLAQLASLAKARMGDTLHAVSNECVQMHGGIGMTDAADPGLYLKRARVTEALYGSASFHRDRYGRLIGF